jgi:hypothetical protein
MCSPAHDGDALAVIRAARSGDTDEIARIYNASPDISFLTGQVVGGLLNMAEIVAVELGSADGAALIGRILDAASGEIPAAPELPADGPERVVIDLGDPEVTAPAIAAILAAFDGDKDGLNAVLGTLTHIEAISIAALFAYGIAQAAAGEDRDEVRASLAQLLQPPQP